MGHGVDNPATGDGDPVCPVCFRLIPLGESVLRRDNLLVHYECFDRTLPWRPPELAPRAQPPHSALADRSPGAGGPPDVEPHDAPTTEVLREIEPAPRAGVCTECLMSALRVDRRALLKAVRVLSHSGRILCAMRVCARCETTTLVVSRRPAPFERLDGKG